MEEAQDGYVYIIKAHVSGRTATFGALKDAQYAGPGMGLSAGATITEHPVVGGIQQAAATREWYRAGATDSWNELPADGLTPKNFPGPK